MELIIKKANEKDIEIIIDLAKIIWLPTYAQINSEEKNNYIFSIIYIIFKRMNHKTIYII
jgi:hypothetical protein